MARPDWRSASAYEELRPLDAPAFAYEFLCRNPEFLADHARLTRKGRARARRCYARVRQAEPAVGSELRRAVSEGAQPWLACLYPS